LTKALGEENQKAFGNQLIEWFLAQLNMYDGQQAITSLTYHCICCSSFANDRKLDEMLNGENRLDNVGTALEIAEYDAFRRGIVAAANRVNFPAGESGKPFTFSTLEFGDNLVKLY